MNPSVTLAALASAPRAITAHTVALASLSDRPAGKHFRPTSPR